MCGGLGRDGGLRWDGGWDGRADVGIGRISVLSRLGTKC